MIRKAVENDLCAVADIYNEIHTEEEAGRMTIGWKREIYPTYETAKMAWKKGELYVEEADGQIVASARINQEQDREYADGKWEFPALDSDVMVLHTLVVSPSVSGGGYGRKFVAFYEQLARESGCHYLRMDTIVINQNARRFYKKLGYREAGVISSEFYGIGGVRLVCLEKKL